MSRLAVLEAKQDAARMISDHFGINYEAARKMSDYLQRRGANLHTRYEAQCSYQWADTDEYRRGTDMMECTLLSNARAFGFIETDDCNEHRPGAYIRLQRDPCGWPVEIILNGRATRLGGKYQ